MVQGFGLQVPFVAGIPRTKVFFLLFEGGVGEYKWPPYFEEFPCNGCKLTHARK